LVKYLSSTVSACDDDCQEAAQLAIIQVIQKIQTDQIREPKAIKSYLFTCAKRNIYRMTRFGPTIVYDERAEYSIDTAQETDNIINKEMEELLKKCINKLDDKNKAFIHYLLENPKMKTEEIAEHFNMTVNATWQKKHRLIHKLRECAQKYDK
jgi:RNA polymerase sigma factor (sigma-70 family)